MEELSPTERYVVTQKYAGPNSSDREEQHVVFGPDTRQACERYVEGRNWSGPSDFIFRVTEEVVRRTVNYDED